MSAAVARATPRNPSKPSKPTKRPRRPLADVLASLLCHTKAGTTTTTAVATTTVVVVAGRPAARHRAPLTSVILSQTSLRRSLANSLATIKARRVLAAERAALRADFGRLLPEDVRADGPAVAHAAELRRIATRGIVKLFNAVAEAQKQTALLRNRQASAGSCAPEPAPGHVVAARRVSVARSTFLDMLRGRPRESSSALFAAYGCTIAPTFEDANSPSSKSGSWCVLSEDFLGARLKDWDEDRDADNINNNRDDDAMASRSRTETILGVENGYSSASEQSEDDEDDDNDTRMMELEEEEENELNQDLVFDGNSNTSGDEH